MRILDSAVNRVTRTNKTLGEEHKLSPLDGLKAMTLWSAYQHFEESIKGSIEIGKQADFVVLNKNPITIASEEIKNIQVLKTINDDKIVFSSEW
jgi:hypothetical protein